MFLTDGQQSAYNRFLLLTYQRDQSGNDSNLSIISLRQERPFEKREPNDLNNWQCERFNLDPVFDKILSIKSELRCGFYIDGYQEKFLRDSNQQPSLILQTQDEIHLLSKQS